MNTADILTAAKRCPKQAWFGEHRVYISEVYAQLKAEGYEGGLEQFKLLLLAAKQRRELFLGRADMPHLLDEEMCEVSRISVGEDSFVFLRVDDE